MITTLTDSIAETTIPQFVILTACSLAAGLIIALIHMYRNTYSKGFVISLVVMPAIIQIIIMLVNGSIGTGIAVAGAFSLIRFRSQPGNAREITSIFLAMAVGLATGTGYIGVAGLILAFVGVVILLLTTFSFGKHREPDKELRITVPESLDYEGLFEDVLKEYTVSCKLDRVKTTNMGSMYELNYILALKPDVSTKKMIDEIRTRNGNLPVALHNTRTEKVEL